MKIVGINWDVVWSCLRTLLVAGGPVATLLIAMDFPPVQVGKWMAISLAVIGILSVVGPGLKGALKQTNSGKMASVGSMSEDAKVAAVATLSPTAQAQIATALPTETKVAVATSLSVEDKTAVAATLPDEIKIAAVTAIPEVTKVEVKDNATNGVAKALADSNEPKVVPQSKP